jgi:CBS domain-containing protein
MMLMESGIKVSDAMTKNPVIISAEETILNCAKLMLERRVGSVLITHDELLEGIITEKDVVRVMAKGLDPNETTVGEIMNKRLRTTEPGEEIEKVMHHMHKNKVRRLPVLFDGKLAGIITQNDILKIQPALFELLMAKGNINQKTTKEKYWEGDCGSCGNFAQLHERDGQFICAECLEEHGEEPHEDDQ